MTFPTGEVAVVGVYTTEQARWLDGRTRASLQLESIKGALDDAGLSHADVDGLIPLDPNPLAGRSSRGWEAPMFWAEQLGGRPVTYMAGGQGAGGVAKAAVAIAAGMCNVVVIFWGSAGYRIGPAGAATPQSAPRVFDWSFGIHGAYMAAFYALWARRYMYEYQATSEDLAEVAVIAREHAVLNPDSVMGKRGTITKEDVLSSRMICEPLHLLDCALENDGGYAIVVASKDVARTCRTKPVWILGGAESTYTDFYSTVESPWFPKAGKSVRRCTDLAFQMAGVSRDEIDVAELYDCFTITLLRDLEEMGFCGLGEGPDFVNAGHTRLGGRMPCNTDGGLLSNSHNANPSGMQVVELTRQLRGDCGPRQVEGARIGIALAQGMAVHGQASAVIMAAS
jgi:acetyl-CoA acetyltransferase